MSKDIVQRLRGRSTLSDMSLEAVMEASADRIEALEAEVADLKADNARINNAKMDALLKAEAAEAQASRMRDALEKIVQGDYPRSGRNFYDATTRTPSKHDTCGHGKAYWDDCGNCCSSFARKALDEQ